MRHAVAGTHQDGKGPISTAAYQRIVLSTATRTSDKVVRTVNDNARGQQADRDSNQDVRERRELAQDLRMIQKHHPQRARGNQRDLLHQRRESYIVISFSCNVRTYMDACRGQPQTQFVCTARGETTSNNSNAVNVHTACCSKKTTAQNAPPWESPPIVPSVCSMGRQVAHRPAALSCLTQ